MTKRNGVSGNSARATSITNGYPMINRSSMEHAIKRATAHSTAASKVVKCELPLGAGEAVRQASDTVFACPGVKGKGITIGSAVVACLVRVLGFVLACASKNYFPIAGTIPTRGSASSSAYFVWVCRYPLERSFIKAFAALVTQAVSSTLACIKVCSGCGEFFSTNRATLDGGNIGAGLQIPFLSRIALQPTHLSFASPTARANAAFVPCVGNEIFQRCGQFLEAISTAFKGIHMSNYTILGAV